MNQFFKTLSSAQTKKFAAILAEEILNSPPKRRATVLALQGDLGTGKTTFAQGFLKGLGIKEKTASPTFIIMRRFKIYDSRFKNFYHVDAYRLKYSEASILSLKELIHDPKNIVLIEWAENIKKLIPKYTLHIHFSHKAKNERVIQIKTAPR